VALPLLRLTEDGPACAPSKIGVPPDPPSYRLPTLRVAAPLAWGEPLGAERTNRSVRSGLLRGCSPFSGAVRCPSRRLRKPGDSPLALAVVEDPRG
jgi:hypothetical protein